MQRETGLGLASSTAAVCASRCSVAVAIADNSPTWSRTTLTRRTCSCTSVGWGSFQFTTGEDTVISSSSSAIPSQQWSLSRVKIWRLLPFSNRPPEAALAWLLWNLPWPSLASSVSHCIKNPWASNTTHACKKMYGFFSALCTRKKNILDDHKWLNYWSFHTSPWSSFWRGAPNELLPSGVRGLDCGWPGSAEERDCSCNSKEFQRAGSRVWEKRFGRRKESFSFPSICRNKMICTPSTLQYVCQFLLPFLSMPSIW